MQNADLTDFIANNSPLVSPRFVYLNRFFLFVGIFALGYSLYDLLSPGHFTGDMYGLEVTVRLFIMFLAVFPMILGGLLKMLGKRKSSAKFWFTGAILILISSICLVIISIDVGRSRHLDHVRSTYPGMTVTELMRLVRNKKDQFAVDAIGEKGSQEAVEALKQILCNEDENTVLRICAADRLSQYENPALKTFLESIRHKTRNVFLKRHLKDLLEYKNKFQDTPRRDASSP